MTAEAATSIKLSKSKATIYVGNSIQLKLNGATASKVVWSSSDDTIAKVSSSGKVTALKKGTVDIVAKYDGKSYKCKITVKSAKLSDTKLSLRVGYGYSLNVVNTEGKIKWESSNTSIAKVNSNGFISPMSEGTCKITAKVASETYTCNLKVVAPFTEEDFIFDDPSDEGYTNYIDYTTGKGSTWYWYLDNAASVSNCNRGLNIGDTYDDFISAYGYCDEYATVSLYDKFKEHFNNSAYPRTKITMDYEDKLTYNHYYKSFYFDKDGTLVLIIWHR